MRNADKPRRRLKTPHSIENGGASLVNPPQPQTRSERQYVRLDAFERDVADRVASIRGKRISSIFRILVMEEARRLRLPLRSLRAQFKLGEKNLGKPIEAS
jgi:hypothetical protein